MSNTRNNSDGFKGQYPRDDDAWVVKMYRDAGMEPPWLLEYEDGRVVGPAESHDDAVPRHEA